jgi:hypothetical protein
MWMRSVVDNIFRVVYKEGYYVVYAKDNGAYATSSGRWLHDQLLNTGTLIDPPSDAAGHWALPRNQE